MSTVLGLPNLAFEDEEAFAVSSQLQRAACSPKWWVPGIPFPRPGSVCWQLMPAAKAMLSMLSSD